MGDRLSRANAPPPADAYADFMRRLAAHFRGRVGAYEIWNEPDEGIFWEGEATPDAYAALLKPAYSAVKSADPAAKVGVGGLVGQRFWLRRGALPVGRQGLLRLRRRAHRHGLQPAPTRGRRPRRDGRISRWSFTGYREVRASMLDHGDDKPIWMTELGWSVTGDRCPQGIRRPPG